METYQAFSKRGKTVQIQGVRMPLRPFIPFHPTLPIIESNLVKVALMYMFMEVVNFSGNSVE